MIKVTNFEESYQELLAENLAVAYISQPNCSVCLAVKPRLKKLSADQKVPLYHFDASLLPQVAGSFQVMTAPAVLFFVNGKEINRQARFIDFQLLARKIQDYQEVDTTKPVDYATLFQEQPTKNA